MVAGPEQARLLKEFEDDYLPQDKNSQYGCHYEEKICAQKTFKEQAASLILGHQ